MKDKKAISAIVIVLLMLMVVAVAGAGLYTWFKGFQSEYTAKQQIQADSQNLEILGVQYVNEERSLVGIRNKGSSYHIVETLRINDVECNVVGSNVVEDIANLYVDCPVDFEENIDVVLVSDKGVSSKTFTSFEVGEDEQQNFEANDLEVNFRSSSSCELWETKIYAMEYVNASHAQIPSQTSYSYSVCLNHSLYTVGTECDQSYVNLFYLGGATNSHIYTSKSSADDAPWSNYYDWYDVCVNTLGADIYKEIDSSAPNSSYVCVGSVDTDDVAGGVVGNCDMYSDKIWLYIG